MLTTALKGTHMDITPAIRSYAEEKIRAIERFIDTEGQDVYVEIELGKTTRHHQTGEIFRAEVMLRAPHVNLRAESAKEDLYAAIDTVKDEIIAELKKHKGKHETLSRKGGRMLKDIVRKIGFGE